MRFWQARREEQRDDSRTEDDREADLTGSMPWEESCQSRRALSALPASAVSLYLSLQDIYKCEDWQGRMSQEFLSSEHFSAAIMGTLALKRTRAGLVDARMDLPWIEQL
jgi:hypothetical protein